jgi:hypothetical protein
VYWLVALATHCSGLFQPMHCDYSCRLRVAREWAGGKALYRETYDNPQPVVFLWVLASDSPRPALTAFLAETALAAGGCAVFRAALLTVVPRLAGVIPLVLIVFSGVSPTFYGGQIAEAPAMWLDVVGLSCFWLAVRGYGLWLAGAAGVCFFLMVNFRVPSAVHVVAWLPLMWLGAARPLAKARCIAAAGGGVLIGLAALYLHGQMDGYWDEMLVVLRRNLNYGTLDRIPLAKSVGEGIKTLARIHLANTAAGILLIAGVVVAFSLRARLRSREKAWLVTAVVWMAAALASAFPGGRHYAHYYHMTWPAITLLAMLWLAPLRRMVGVLPRKGNPVDRLTAGVVVGALVLGILVHLFAGAKAVRDLGQGRHAWNAIAEAEEFIRRQTAADTPVVVNVWLDWAELYWRVPRPAPSLSVPHVVPRDLYGEWLEKTSRGMPAWIVTDGTAWEPIDGPLMDEQARMRRDEFVGQIEREYAEMKRIEGLRILRRKGAP